MAFTDTLVTPQADIPGAFQHTLERRVPGGLIQFETAPAGFTTKDGERRKSDWRAYHFTPNPKGCTSCEATGRVPGAREGRTKQCPGCKGTGNMSKRTRIPSVTTILDGILPKPGLPPWAEARGIEGAIEAIRLGIIPIWAAVNGNNEFQTGLDPDAAANAVNLVRANRLGADRARDDAATRGLNIHDLLQTYMETGDAPDPAQHPVEHHGYIRALVDFLLAVDPEPIAVEELVCDPVAGYAGRYDLCAKLKDGRVGLFDAKTQERGGIYESAHLQVEMYRRAMLACGDGEMDFTTVVVFAANGDWRQMPAVADRFVVDKALEFAAALKPVSSACAKANRLEIEARKAVAA